MAHEVNKCNDVTEIRGFKVVIRERKMHGILSGEKTIYNSFVAVGTDG